MRARVGLDPASRLGRDVTETAAALAEILGLMLAIGGVVVGSAAWALGGAAAAVLGWAVKKALTTVSR